MEEGFALFDYVHIEQAGKSYRTDYAKCINRM